MTQAGFPSLPARSRADPAFSPRNRSARSRHSPRLASRRKSWEPAEAGLTALERGLLLHEVSALRLGGPAARHSFAQGASRLFRISARSSLTMCATSSQHSFPRARANAMPSRYLDLEQTRLASLVVEWLRCESKRVPFTVAETEAGHERVHLRSQSSPAPRPHRPPDRQFPSRD
jgi:hypothetical protein